MKAASRWDKRLSVAFDRIQHQLVDMLRVHKIVGTTSCLPPITYLKAVYDLDQTSGGREWKITLYARAHQRQIEIFPVPLFVKSSTLDKAMYLIELGCFFYRSGNVIHPAVAQAPNVEPPPNDAPATLSTPAPSPSDAHDPSIVPPIGLSSQASSPQSDTKACDLTRGSPSNGRTFLMAVALFNLVLFLVGWLVRSLLLAL